MSARYETIAKWINNNGWQLGAELGVFSGRTHFYLLEHCPSLKLIGIDVWDMPGFAEGKSKSGEKCHCDYCNETRGDRRAETAEQMRLRVVDRSTKDFGERSIIFVEQTTQAARRVKDGSLDFVFVDGDHSTEGVMADIYTWMPKLRLNSGCLIGHDWNLKSVRSAVAKFFDSDASVKIDNDHLWCVENATKHFRVA